MYFHHVLSLSTCKESKDKLCYSDVLMFQTFIYMFLCSRILRRAQIILIYLLSFQSIKLFSVIYC